MNESETTTPEAVTPAPETAPEEMTGTAPVEETTTPEAVTPAPETAVVPETAAEGMPEQPVVAMPNVAAEVAPEAPSELLPCESDNEAQATMRATYLAFWKQSGQEKWDAESEALMAKLAALA